MDADTVKITIDGQERKYPYGTTFREIAKEYQSRMDAPIILALADGKLRELHKKAKRDGTLSFVTTKDEIGNQAYRRSACLVLLKAIFDVAGKENIKRVVIHYSMGSGYYFTMSPNENSGETVCGEKKLSEMAPAAEKSGGLTETAGNCRVVLNQEFLDRVKARMLELADEDIPIMKRSVGTDEAISLFHRHGMYDKEKLFRYRRVSRVNIYSIENFEDYFYGFMACSTGYIKYFDLKLYDDGFVLLLPRAREPKVIPPFSPDRKIFLVQKESEEWGEKLGIANVGELNDQITENGFQKILLMQEALQEARISRIADRIVQENKRLVLIAGPSSSGKTTFSHRLSIQLAARGMKPHPVAVDNYFVNRENTPLDEFGNRNYECLEAIDVELFNQNMLDLLAGKRVEIPSFNFKTGQREYKGDFLSLGPEDVLVMEGIHGLNDRLSYALPKESKFKIYISALTQLNVDEHNRIPTTDGRLLRRIVRDARTRGTAAKDTIAMWPSVRRGEEENIFPYQEEADEMFNSALIYELACLKVYAEPLLFGIEKTAPEYLEANRLLKFLDYFVAVPSEEVPNNSLLREFIGGSCFNV